MWNSVDPISMLRSRKFVGTVIGLVIGLPGTLEDIETWSKWLAIDGWQWWNYSLIVLGLSVILWGWYPTTIMNAPKICNAIYGKSLSLARAKIPFWVVSLLLIATVGLWVAIDAVVFNREEAVVSRVVKAPKEKKLDTKPVQSIQKAEEFVVSGEAPRIYTVRKSEDLIKSVTGLTSIEADRVVEPHIGKWLKVEGSINDISLSKFSEDFYYILNIGHPLDRTHVVLFFEKSWGPTIETMQRGDWISAEGKINSIDNRSIMLKQCELLATEGR